MVKKHCKELRNSYLASGLVDLVEHSPWSLSLFTVWITDLCRRRIQGSKAGAELHSYLHGGAYSLSCVTCWWCFLGWSSKAVPNPDQNLPRFLIGRSILSAKQVLQGREDTVMSVFPGDQRDAGVTLLQKELCCCLYSFG